MKYTLFILSFFFSNTKASNNQQRETRNDSFCIINKIIISGNKITKDKIIKRELTFLEGDTISTLFIDSVLKVTKNNNALTHTRLRT